MIRFTKNIMRKKKKSDWTFRVKIQVIKSAISSYRKVAGLKMFLILNN